jgi:predicted phage-related endonuclease
MPLINERFDVKLSKSRESWLEWRNDGIGASEAWGACMDPLGVYVRKLKLVPDEPFTREQQIGLALETGLYRLYEEDIGSGFTSFQTPVESEEHDFIRATLDGIAVRDGQERPVELKTINAWAARRNGFTLDDPESIPDRWRCQLQQQLYVTGAEQIDLAVLYAGTQFSVITYERNETLINQIVEAEVDLWGRIQRREPPEASEETEAFVFGWLYPQSDTTVSLDETVSDLCAAYEQLLIDAREQEEEKDELKARILNALGPHRIGEFPDGSSVKRTIVDVAEGTYTRKAHRQIRLTFKHPK